MKALAFAMAALALALPVGAELSPLGTRIDAQIAAMTNLVLRERVSRYFQAGKKVCRRDTFETVVNVFDGVEHYSEVKGREKGIWSFGEAVTMLRTTREQIGDSRPGDVFRYRCAASDRRWFASVGSTTYWLDFEASVGIAPATGDIRSIAWTSSSLPPETGIARITWTLDFQSVDVAGRICTIPRTGVYRVDRTGSRSRAEWNVIEFSPAGRYGSEAEIRFGQ
jgi:hypothetical protein